MDYNYVLNRLRVHRDEILEYRGKVTPEDKELRANFLGQIGALNFAIKLIKEQEIGDENELGG